MSKPFPPSLRANRTNITEQSLSNLVDNIGGHFRTFGGGRGTRDNPISMALIDNPLQFAAGVDVKEVVQFVLNELNFKVIDNNHQFFKKSKKKA